MMNKRKNTEFGIVLTLVLLVTGLVSGAVIWFKISVFALLVSVLAPVVYTPLSWLWFGFGQLTERWFSSIILTLVFYLVVTPVALFRKSFSEDTFRLRSFKKHKNSAFLAKDKTFGKDDLDKQY